MSKYIDAEKLIERLEEIKQAEYENCGGVNAKTGALQEVQELITSLQQEQPEVDLWKEIDKYFSKWVQGASDEGCFNADSQLISIYDCHRIARHFYELGLNARKEENK